MPRTARKKSEVSMYHVMCRSISEIDLFKCDEDKAYYLSLLKHYISKFQCSIYAYCLMSNHLHFYLNTRGFDISSFMKHLNTAYVSYFNKRYNRHGHLFQGRFASTIVDSNTYSLTLSAYIHNNAKDLPDYSGKEELYPYSSYGIYTGCRKDIEGIVDIEFLLGLFSNNKREAQQKYKIFTKSMKDTGIVKEVDDNIIRAYTENEYRSEKTSIRRYEEISQVVQIIGNVLSERVDHLLKIKHNKEIDNIRAFTIFVVKTLCNCTYKKICDYIGNITMSGVTRLSNKGYKVYQSDAHYKNVFSYLI
jgi:putative transposase